MSLPVTVDVTLLRVGRTMRPMPRKPPMTELDRHAGLRLRAVRDVWDEAGPVRQETFAAKLGVTRTALANWEGGRLPDVRAMVRLHEWIGIPLEWIYLGQLRHVERDLAKRLEVRCSLLGADLPELRPDFIAVERRRPAIEGFRERPATLQRRAGPRGFHEETPGNLKPDR